MDVYGVAMWVPVGARVARPAVVWLLEGENRREENCTMVRQSLWLAVALGVVLCALLSLAVHALGPMGIAPEIRPGAAEFLRGIRWGVPALTLYYCMRYLSDGLHWTLPTMVLGFGGLLLLVPLGWVLTFGLFGLPELGAEIGRASGWERGCQY